jgi:dTDP-4-dehydrorhamnose reductase
VSGERHGAELFARHTIAARPPERPTSGGPVELTDSQQVRRTISGSRPDAIVHAAILNDFGRLYTHRRESWDAYVGATRSIVDAANDAGAQVALDGTQSGAAENTPPNPINLSASSRRQASWSCRSAPRTGRSGGSRG